ncbi:MAG: hypothetical protein ACOC90_04635 [Bacteroidota bacterium]
MSDDKTKGGIMKKAFPVPDNTLGHPNCQGMTLRQYYAAKAMQAIITGFYANADNDSPLPDHSLIASDLFRMADEMIKLDNQNE